MVGRGDEGKKAPSAKMASSSRRESSSRRYRVEIPTACDEEEGGRYTPSLRSKASTRRTRSELPRRSHLKCDDNMVDKGAPNQQVASTSSKKKRHNVDMDEEIGMVHATSMKKTHPTSPRRESERRAATVKQECHHRTNVKDHRTSTLQDYRASTLQDHRDGNKPSSTEVSNPDRKSNTKKNGNTAKTTTTNNKSTKKTNSSIAVAELIDDDEPLVPKRHCIWMPFGHARTWSAVLLMGIGITLAILARRSTSFVKLSTPLQLSPHMAPITDVGLIRLNLCYNTNDYMESIQDMEVAVPYMNSVVDMSDETTTTPLAHSSCYTVRLSAEIVEDTMWEVSRLSASLAIFLGIFFCVLLISTVYWESINMKPMAIGLLITYLLQSFSFFFYDSELCREHSCKLASGTYLSIIASFCWFGASMVCILMDVYHTRKMRRLARLEKRRRRRLRRAERLARKASTATSKTETSSDISSEDDVFDNVSPDELREADFENKGMAVPV